MIFGEIVVNPSGQDSAAFPTVAFVCLPLYFHLQMVTHSRIRTKNRRPRVLHLQCYMVIAGDVKEPTHPSQRVGNVVPGVVV